MNSVKKLPEMLAAIQHAGVPETFNQDFLSDLGYTSSYDRALTKVLKYLGMLDSSNRPQEAYRRFVDHTKSNAVMAECLLTAYDDLFRSDKKAHEKTSTELTGWFKTKTGSGDAVAKKIATTFKSLAGYGDFSSASKPPPVTPKESDPEPKVEVKVDLPTASKPADFGLVYRFEIHLPDTQNVDTFRSIFKALREELMG